MANEMESSGYEFKKALPNKLLQDDGTITDITGKEVVVSTEAYDGKQSLPNKFLNPDGSYSTLNEIIASMVDTDVFVIVDELPATGNPQKIYIVPNGSGGFDEYRWTGTKWDNVGMIEFDITNYYTKTEVENLISTALNNAKSYADTKKAEAITSANNYTDTQIQEKITQALGGDY